MYLQDRDIRAVLRKNDGTEKIIQTLDNNTALSQEQQVLFTGIVVRDMIEICNTPYPSTEDKLKLASQIVLQFPILGFESDTQPLHVLWFSPKGSSCGKKASGKIEYKLGNLQKRLDKHLKKNIASPRPKKKNLEISELNVSYLLYFYS